MQDMVNSKLIPIGKIVKACGIKGEVKAFIEESYRNYVVEQEKSIRIFLEGDKKQLSFIIRREEAKFLVLSINGITNRNLAENIIKKKLCSFEEDLPQLEEDEFYYSSLKNLPVYEGENHIGKIKDLFNYGAGDIIEIELLNGETVLYPFNKEIFVSITKDKAVVVQPNIN